MANHGYVKTRTKMNPTLVHKAILEINQRRFRGKMIVDTWIGEPGMIQGWQLYYEIKGQENLGFEVWLTKSRLLEFRHGFSSQWQWWAQGVVQEELGQLFKGKCSDDGVEKSWSPNSSKSPISLTTSSDILDWQRSPYGNFYCIVASF